MPVFVRLLLRLMQRQIRLPIVQVYMLSVTVACTVMVSVLLLGNRFEQHFLQQAKHLLAADAVLESSSELTAAQIAYLRAQSLQYAETITFATMASAKEQFLLASIKAVSNQYPLIGELQVAPDRYEPAHTLQHGPAKGQVWVEERVLDQLGLEIGDVVHIGKQAFTIDQLLRFEPDRGSQFYSFTPRVMMNLDDVTSTAVIQPGSRVKYRYLLAAAPAQLETIIEHLSPALLPNQKFLTVDSSNQMLSSSLQQAMRFLTSSALVAIVLGAMAIALAAYKTTQSISYSYALMRSLGMRQQQLRLAAWIPFSAFTLIAIAIGLVLGYFLHQLVVQQVMSMLAVDLPMADRSAYIFSAIASLLAALLFAWPFIRRLQNVMELELLTRQVTHPARWAVLISMSAGLISLCYWMTKDWASSAAMTAAMIVLLGVLYGMVNLIIRMLTSINIPYSLAAQLAARLLRTQRQWVNLQISVFALSVLAITLVITLGEDLLHSWQERVPESAPNFFAMNLYPQDVQRFKRQLDQIGAKQSPLYPIVRGRLSSVNGEPLRQYASKESDRSDESLQRDLALTYSKQLPVENEIISGSWHDDSSTDVENTVSVEQGVAENLDIVPGDHLEFTIGTNKITARVTSIRSVEWESFRPNFYMIFYPGALDDLPTTYLTSFYLNAKQRKYIAELVNAFPTATFFDVEFLLNRIESMAKQITASVNVLLLVALLAALIIFIIIEVIQYQVRLQSSTILKSLGASNLLLLKIYGLQFLTIGILSGLLALVLNLAAGTVLQHYLFAGDFVFNRKTLLITLVLTPAIVVITGLLAVRRSRNTTPTRLLQSLQ